MALRSRAPLPIPARVGETAPDSVTSAVRQSRPRASTREGKRAVQVWLDPEAVTQMGYLALDERTTIQALMEEAVEELFVRRGKPRLRT